MKPSDAGHRRQINGILDRAYHNWWARYADERQQVDT